MPLALTPCLSLLTLLGGPALSPEPSLSPSPPRTLRLVDEPPAMDALGEPTRPAFTAPALDGSARSGVAERWFGSEGKAGAQDGAPQIQEVIWTDEPSGSAGWVLGDDNEISFGFGGAFWSDLPDLQPEVGFPTSQGFGSIQSWGFAFDVAYHHRIIEQGQTSVWLGGRFAVQGWEERQSFLVRLPNGEVIDDDVSASVLSLTLSARLEHDFGAWSGFVGAGGGYYEFQVSEDSGYWGGQDVITDDSSLGGFASFGIDFDVGPNTVIRLENQVHFVRFTGIDDFTPGRNSISGPYNVVQLAFGARF